MTREEALVRAAIDHWARLAVLEPLHNEFIGPIDCPLCIEYHGDCRNCPVMKKTGVSCCGCTPYAEAERARYNDCSKDEQKACNLKEVEFLLTLLPKGRQ